MRGWSGILRDNIPYDNIPYDNVLHDDILGNQTIQKGGEGVLEYR